MLPSLCCSDSFLLSLIYAEIIVHDVPQRRQLLKLPSAHKGKVSGLCWSSGDLLLSCGVDRNVKLWDTQTLSDADGDIEMEAGPSQVF